MKFSKYFMLAGVAAVLAACSSDEPEFNGYPVPAEVAENDIYGKIALQMPAQSASRGAEPFDEDDKTTEEYKVANGRILIFQKSKDANAKVEDATFVKYVSLSSTWEDDKKATDISRLTYVPVAFTKGTFKEGESYVACIVLNYNDKFPFPAAGTSFKTWATTATDASFIYTPSGTSSQYITMVSAPEYKESKKTGVALVDLDTKNAVTDMTELGSATAMADFYVHRVPAKITVTDDSKKVFEFDKESAYPNHTVQIVAWDADVTAKKCFPIQNVFNLDLSAKHMNTVSNEAFKTFNRCNWAEGAFYAGTYDANNYNRTAAPTKFLTHVYVKENTMDYQNQIEKRTTRVNLKAVFKEKDKDPQTFVKVGAQATLHMSVDAFKTEIETKATVLLEGTPTVTMKTGLKAGYYSLKDFCEIKDKDGKVVEDANKLNAIAVQLGLQNADAKEISLYVDGVCYYTILVRHFDDIEVPLGKTINTAADYEAKHLGRYGVLRNNWYEINVDDITRLGTPVVPDPTDDPDDKPQGEVQGMDFHIYMLNWAKRTQTSTL